MKQLIKKKNDEELLSWSLIYTKVSTEEYSKTPIELNPLYRSLNLHDSRVLFRKITFLLQTVRHNFHGNKRYKAEGYLCPDCQALTPPVMHPDDQVSLLTCQGNIDLRLGKDMSDIKQEIEYYREVIKRRKELFKE